MVLSMMLKISTCSTAGNEISAIPHLFQNITDPGGRAA
jgi:hypothetical protein